MSEKKTGWYSADQKPARAGWYERWFTDGCFMQHWDGKFWRASIGGKPHWRQLSDAPYPVWRGLTPPAKAKGSA